MATPLALALLAAALASASSLETRPAPAPRLEVSARSALALMPLEPVTGILRPLTAMNIQARVAPAAAAHPAVERLGADLQALPAGGVQAQAALDRTFEHAAAARQEDAGVLGIDGLLAGSAYRLQPAAPHAPTPARTLPAPAAPAPPRVSRWKAAVLSAWSLFQPTWPLQPAAGPPDASFLVQKAYGYKDDPAFTRPMAEAIAGSAAYLEKTLKEGRSVSSLDVREMMNHVARVRREIAQTKGDRSWESFGNPLPEDEASMAAFYTPDGRQEWLSWAGSQMGDILKDDPADRHFPFYLRASQFQRASDIPWEIEADGRRFPNSHVDRVSPTKLHLMHPTFAESVPMRRYAFMIVADAINDRRMSEAHFMDRLALAYQLFVHATPWARGTPSIIEAYFDAALRAKFGKTLPPKTSEPFWDAALRDPRRGPYTGRDFLKNFGGA